VSACVSCSHWDGQVDDSRKLHPRVHACVCIPGVVVLSHFSIFDCVRNAKQVDLSQCGPMVLDALLKVSWVESLWRCNNTRVWLGMTNGSDACNFRAHLNLKKWYLCFSILNLFVCKETEVLSFNPCPVWENIDTGPRLCKSAHMYVAVCAYTNNASKKIRCVLQEYIDALCTSLLTSYAYTQHKLSQIKNEIDSTLTFRRSCREGARDWERERWRFEREIQLEIDRASRTECVHKTKKAIVTVRASHCMCVCAYVPRQHTHHVQEQMGTSTNVSATYSTTHILSPLRAFSINLHMLPLACI